MTVLLFGASKETWATIYCSNRLPASKALLGEPLEHGRLARRPKGRGFGLGGLIDDPGSVQETLETRMPDDM